MGNTFTLFGRHTLKRIRRFNVQHRTDKYLEKHKEKPERAPMYEATMREVERLAKEMPDLTEEIKKKDGTLLNNLRKVYVTSTGDNKDSFSTQRVDSSGEARYLEAIKQEKGEVVKDVPPGKYTMEQALTLIQQYQNNPMMNTPKALAAKFNLDPTVVANITKHVKILDYTDTRKKRTQFEFLTQDLLPRSFQGKDDLDLMRDLQIEADKRNRILFEKAARLRSKEKDQLYIESQEPIDNFLSRETDSKKEQIYTDLEIYRKSGKLPEGPKLIEGRRLDDLSIEDIQKLTSGKSDDQQLPDEPVDPDSKESDKKDTPEDKQQKAANKT